jgi:hypothetical protein
VHNLMRTHGSKGATEPGRGGPRPVGPAHFGGRFGPVFLAPEGFNPKSLGTAIRQKERAIRTRRPSTSLRERGRRSLEGDRLPRRKHPHVEKKEDTVGRETMINGAMCSTLMG